MDEEAELTRSLKYLRLPTMRGCYEEAAQQAERESLSWERYLHELVQRECEERQENPHLEEVARVAVADREIG